MMCYRDKSWCSQGDNCANRFTCHDRLTRMELDRAKQLGLPVQFVDFRDTCPKWEPKKEDTK